ncbi:MAG: hypothetical protein CM15mP49_30180 [Actinomycetota bacterium]|nr:MAG: hypothetical protein CM15mP49_30180 [Actinomycetota bacterium]
MIPEPEGSMNAYMESLTMLLERKDKFFTQHMALESQIQLISLRL